MRTIQILMKKVFGWRPALLAVVSSAFLLTACKDPQVDPSSPGTGNATAANPYDRNFQGTVTDANLNRWILDSMQVYYYWNDKLPDASTLNFDQQPNLFFESLLYRYNRQTRPDGDRFSFMYDNAQDLKNSLSGIARTTGMEFRLNLYPSGTDNVIGRVLYVLPNSPAARAGVKRGDIFNKIDGQTLTRANFATLLDVSQNIDTRTYTFVTATNGQLSTGQDKRIQAIQLAEDPVLLDTTFTVGSKKIGYLVYNQFITGPGGPTDRTYDQKIDNAFARFKGAGINELVVDLRYNPGGYVSSALNLASLIGKGIDNSKVFYRQEYNKLIMDQFNRAGQAGGLSSRFSNKSQNVGANLQRVFVLTSDATASASELLINGLKPYMDVQVIGDTTVGKNVGSITIEDRYAARKVKLGLQPIVTKSFNSLGQSDYSGGFVPNAVVFETNLVLPQLGDIANEPLLRTAVGRITGTANGRLGVGTQREMPSVGSSLDDKAAGGNMFFDAPNGLFK